MLKKVKPTISEKDAQALQDCRRTIDNADRALFSALSHRFKAVEKVGKIKHKNAMPLYQKARWQEVVKDRIEQATALKVDARFTRALLALIHKEAIRIQKKEKKKLEFHGIHFLMQSFIINNQLVNINFNNKT